MFVVPPFLTRAGKVRGSGSVGVAIGFGADAVSVSFYAFLAVVGVVGRFSVASFGELESLSGPAVCAVVLLVVANFIGEPRGTRSASRSEAGRRERSPSFGSGELSALVSKTAVQRVRHFCKEFSSCLRSWFANLRDLLVHARSNKASWQVLNFLVLQSGMATVELIYATLWHSSGLISISADNFFCSVALAIGLLAIRVTTRKPTSTHTYGFSRFESICGFANGVMLVYVAVLIVLEAFERFHDTDNIAAGHAFAVCLFGMTGNVLGLYFFPPESRRENHNVQGIYLHIWANTLAFASMAISTAITTAVPAWEPIDLLTSTLVGIGVIAFAIPLMVRSARLLLLLVPVEKCQLFASVKSRLNDMDGVVKVEALRVWNLTPTCLVASVRIQVSKWYKGQDVEILYEARSVLASMGVAASQCTIQISRVESDPPAVVFFHKRTQSGFGDTGIDIEGLTASRESTD